MHPLLFYSSKGSLRWYILQWVHIAQLLYIYVYTIMLHVQNYSTKRTKSDMIGDILGTQRIVQCQQHRVWEKREGSHLQGKE